MVLKSQILSYPGRDKFACRYCLPSVSTLYWWRPNVFETARLSTVHTFCSLCFLSSYLAHQERSYLGLKKHALSNLSGYHLFFFFFFWEKMYSSVAGPVTSGACFAGRKNPSAVRSASVVRCGSFPHHNTLFLFSYRTCWPHFSEQQLCIIWTDLFYCMLGFLDGVLFLTINFPPLKYAQRLKNNVGKLWHWQPSWFLAPPFHMCWFSCSSSC